MQVYLAHDWKTPRMKTYILNLPSALERRTFQTQQALRLGLEAQFIDAQTPADIPDAFFQAHAFSWERPIKITEVACFMSHHQVWQQIADSHEPALVLEDDADSRQALCGLLASWGCAVVEASDLVAALALMPRADTAADPIDALVVDLRLPGADDGVTAIARLRQALGSPAPALLVTADAHQTDGLAELVCSNSFRSDDGDSNAVGLLHREMRSLGSIIMREADVHKVPAGSALAALLGLEQDVAHDRGGDRRAAAAMLDDHRAGIAGIRYRSVADEQRVVAANLATLPDAVAQLDGPAVLLYGLEPRHSRAALTKLKEATA